MTRLRHLHRLTAMLLALFILAHLGNHLLLIGGATWHQAGMAALRPVYRNPVVEPILIAAVFTQIVIGLRLIWMRGWPRRFWPRVQVLSGGVLAFFLVQHVGATLLTRAVYDDIDTNVFWAAAVVSRAPFVWYFAPYYVLGVTALFAHLAALLHRRPDRRVWAWPVLALGAAFGIATVAGLMVTPLPPAYDAYLSNDWF